MHVPTHITHIHIRKSMTFAIGFVNLISTRLNYLNELYHIDVDFDNITE